VTVGADSACDVQLTDLEIAPRQAVLEEEDGVVLLRDLAGAGPGTTHLNGQPVQIELLSPGDHIQIGGSVIQFWVHGDAIRPSPSPPDVGTMYDDLYLVTDTVTRKRTMPSPYLPADDSQAVAISLSDTDLTAMRKRPTGDDETEPERVEWALNSLDALYQITEVLGRTFDVESLLEQVLDIVLFTVEGDKGVVLLTEGGIEGHTIRVARRHPGQNRGSDGTDLQVSRTIAQKVLTEGRAVLTTDAAADERFNAGDSVLALNIRSAMCVPLRGREDVLGIIHLDAGDRNVFTEASLRLLATIADMAGKVIENARLHEAALGAERLAAVGETVAGTAHYMKNLLTGLMAGAELVDLGLETDDQDCLQTGWAPIRRNLEILSDLVLNMLDYSRERQPAFMSLDAGELLGDLELLVRHRAERRNIELVVEVEEGMPPLRADPVGMHRAVLNLVTNALDAIPENQSGKVTLAALTVGDRLALEVRDTGEGIPDSVLPQIFDIFCTTKGSRGTGFGLAVTRKIIEEHGGEIEVDTEVGKGTTFRFLLPR
jgi:signal transduction histidine kinase